MPFFVKFCPHRFRFEAGGAAIALLLLSGLCSCESHMRPMDKGQEEKPLFETVENSGIRNENELQPTEEANIITYLYYYNGGGVAATDINGDGLPDLFFTNNQQPNKYYINRGNWQFEDATEAAGLAGKGDWSTGVSVVDVNGDGLPDIYVCNVAGYLGWQGGNELFIQQKDGTFVESAAEYGLDFEGFATQAYWFDYDGDGDLDMYLLCHSVHNDASFGRANLRGNPDPVAGDRLYEQLQKPDGTPIFRLISEVTEDGRAAAAFQANGIGSRPDPDGRAGGHKCRSSVHEKGAMPSLSKPNGHTGEAPPKTTFESGLYTSKIGYGLSAAIADFSGNGRPDLYVCNDFSENDYLYFNKRCDGPLFRENIRQAMGHTSNFSMGSDVGDLDNDGWLDLFTLDMRPADEFTLKHTVSADPYNVYSIKREFGYYHQFPRNQLQWNRGEGYFSEIGQMAGVAASDWSWSALIADFDLDGHSDIFVSNGIWRRPNDLDYLKFTSTEQAASQVSNLELAEQMPPGLVANVAFRNLGKLQFEDVAKAWGLDLLGASSGAAYADFDQDGDLDLVVNNLNAPASLYRNTRRSMESLPPNFYPVADSNLIQVSCYSDGLVAVDWSLVLSGPSIRLSLSDGSQRSIPTTPQRGFQSQSQNKWIGRLAEGLSLQSVSIGGREIGQAAWPNVVVLRQEENRYIDFDAEPLQPWSLSDEGPAVAKGRVGERQGWIFVGAAHGKRAGWIEYSPDGRLVIKPFSPESAIGRDSLFEDVAALLFDANGDGFNDLYVVSGGGQVNSPPAFFADRLYWGSAAGWQRCEDCLPTDFRANGSCVVSADFNGDGFPDLFVGGRGRPGYYGQPGESRVLLNDGQGRFSYDPAWAFTDIGMVTSALWQPIEQRLVLAGDWMPISLLERSEEGWQRSIIPESEGLWRQLTPLADGSFLAANWGWNSALGRPSLKEPLQLYLADLDQNGKPDPIITYYCEGQQHTLADKDELSAQLPILRKNNLSYQDFAGRSFAENFPALVGASSLRAHTLAHTHFRSKPGGQWEAIPLADALQITAVNDILPLSDTEWLLAGNELEVLPRIGRQDAAALQLAQQRDSLGPWEVVWVPRAAASSFGAVRRLLRLEDGVIVGF